MPLKKYINGSWVDTSYKRYETGTDAVTNLPVEIFTDGQPVSSYTLKGNTSVSGTPSPQNPVTISGVGNETANLTSTNAWKNADTTDTRSYFSARFYVSGGSQAFTNVTQIGEYTLTLTGLTNEKVQFKHNGSTRDLLIFEYTCDFSEPTDLTVSFYANGYNPTELNGIDLTNIMLNTGSTALDYEPYGYKISILKDSSPLTPVYLSEPLMGIATADTIVSSGTLTRAYQIVELNSSMYIEAYNATWGTAFTISISNVSSGGEYAAIDAVCSHYPKTTRNNLYRNNVNGICYSGSTNAIIINDVDCATVQDFKNFITAQKEANTPITIVIAVTTPTTETVTVPEITTTGGEVSIDVDTTVKPSELDLTYHGWHEHEPLKRENGSWS